MKLFLVTKLGRGHFVAIVRAKDFDEAHALAGIDQAEVVELESEGPARVLWDDEDCPDSVRDCDG